MKSVIQVYKPIGKTPLEIIDELRVNNKELAKEKLAYAGRLDPMAEGILIILVGDECKKRESYEVLPKEYEAEILIGISTDSYDLMGIVHDINFQVYDKQTLQKELSTFKGSFEQPYPPFSSARVNGRPLFYWARENKLNVITIPTKKVEVYDIKMTNSRYISGNELLIAIIEKVNLVHGEFRQKEIIMKWKEVLKDHQATQFLLITCTINCSSGTYVRSIADDLGKRLKTSSLAFSIKRTKVGDYI